MPIIDLSHPLEEDSQGFPSFPSPQILPYWRREESEKRYQPGVSFYVTRIDMVTNVSTYLDSPFHRYADGADLSQLDLSRLVNLEGRVINTVGNSSSAIEADRIPDNLDSNLAVLIRTDWSRYWKTPKYYESNPYLTRAAVEKLLESQPTLVGIDSTNIDSMRDPSRPVHSILLRHNIPIIEHLNNLSELPDHGFKFHGPVLAVPGCPSFPVRAYAIIPD